MGVTGSPASVLVIGARPAGLFAAAELFRLGVPVRVIEREPRPHRQARATALQPGTLEILAHAGLEAEFDAASMHVGCTRVFDPALTPVAQMTFGDTDSPWGYQCSLPQWRTEEILASRLAELGGTLERGTDVVSVRPCGGGMLTELKHADGTPEHVETRWVIGAGGAHSITRQSLTGELSGETYPGLALAGDVAVAGGLPRDGSALIASPQGYVLLAPLPGDRWITFIGDLHDDEADMLARDISPACAVTACLRRRIPEAVQLTDIGWVSTFHMHRRMAPQLAGERWFLLGDAGHLSSPLGGEGLNSGLHDAHNLAWKLALDVQGRARPGLVHSYEPERAAAARHVLATSDRLHQMAHAAVESARTGVAAAPLSATDAAALTPGLATPDFSYAGSPLTGEYGRPANADGAPDAHDAADARDAADADGAAAGPGLRYRGWHTLTGTAHHLLLADTPQLGRFRERWAGLVEIGRPPDAHRAGASAPGLALIRPDGYVGFRAPPANTAALEALDAHLNSYLIPSQALAR